MGLERISDFRKEKGFTIEELSEKSGVPVSTIKKISAGITTNPNLETIKALAKALGCKLDDFDDGPDTKKSPAPEESEAEESIVDVKDVELVKLFYKLLVETGYVENGDDFTWRQSEAVAAMISIVKAVFTREDKKMAG